MSGSPTLELSVRELAEFVLQAGNLGGGGFTSPSRALAGTRLHQKIQKARPGSYQKEVRLEKEIVSGEIHLLLRGRIDGLVFEDGKLWLEEIKTVQGGWPPEPSAVHWGQAKIYAALYAETVAAAACTVQLTYIHLHSGEIQEFTEEHTPGGLQAFFGQVLASYLKWIQDWEEWVKVRNQSLEALAFPHGSYRRGQRELSVKIYNSIRTRRRLLANAPTGIGKTISALFPALKSMAQGQVTKIFYLTSRTPGRIAAENTMAGLRKQGLRIRTVSLTAKSKICFQATETGCDPTTCPYAIGYYDRSQEAVRDLLATEDISRFNVELVAQKHQVCPFELSLDAAVWADVIIGDYNYLFDPSVSLKRFFQEQPRPYAFIVDEAHHLAERCREMFSARLEEFVFAKVKTGRSAPAAACVRAARKVARELGALAENGTAEPALLEELPEELQKAVLNFSRKTEAFFVENGMEAGDEDLLELYFQALTFLRTADELDEKYRIWKRGAADRVELVLDCVDPSSRIDRILSQGRSAIFISATLLPLDYFLKTLGARPEDNAVALDSPFDPENLGVYVADRISADYKNRSSSYAEVAAIIQATVTARQGNYLAFFPSYQYLQSVLAELEKLPAFARFLPQAQDMKEAEREAFLKEFQPRTDSSLLGLAVMGGIFGEAIDLTGNRLIGTIVVSVGLPQVGFERSLTQALFAGQGCPGFDYAYTFPGYNRVLQAVGRVIRTETDRGVAVLVDRRFSEYRYRKLMPPWWRARRVSGSTELARELENFWNVIPVAETIRLDAPNPDA